MKKKMLFIVTTIVAFALFVPNVMAIDVKTEEEFYTAIEDGTKVDIKKDLNIKLEKDIVITNKVTIGVSSGNVASMNIDLNGHTINLDGSSAQLYVQTKGKLIVNDSAVNGLITTAGSDSSNSFSIHIKGHCELNGGILENTFINKYVVYNQGTFVMNNGIIRNSYSSDKIGNGYAVHNQGTFTMNDGTIINTWKKGGKTVYNNSSREVIATFIMNGGKIVNKAAGNPGYAAAIEGHTIIMNGGEIEAAGTGIVATGSSVEITGGTINAGWYGLLTRYATIKPAEGKQVTITAGKAILCAYDATSKDPGVWNKIYGGNFNAPILIKPYPGHVGNNLEVSGGTFTLNPSEVDVPVDISDYVVEGKYAEKSGTKYEIKEYTQNAEITPIDPEEKVENTTVGLTQNEETEDILMESLEKEITSDPKLEDAIKNNHVVVGIDITSIKENELDNEVVDKFEEVSKDLVIADYFDISVSVNDNNNNKLGSIPELTKDIELVIVLPEKYINTDENVNRIYYVIREHDGKVEILKDVEVSEDGKSIIFKSNKFSTYALAYMDEIIVEPKKEELPPNTGDINLAILIVTILVSAIGAIITSKKIFAKSN